MVLRVPLLDMLEETLDGFTPGRKDRQADHDKQDPLKKRKEKSNDSNENE
jgi:hypothetical protein